MQITLNKRGSQHEIILPPIDAFTEVRLDDEQQCQAAGKLALTIIGRDLDWQLRVMRKELKDGFDLYRAYVEVDENGLSSITMIPRT